MYCLNAISEQTSRMDEQSQLEVVQRIISTMRTTTKGGLIPGADGNRRKLTDPEVRLVNEMTPEVLKLLNRLEKVLGKNPRVSSDRQAWMKTERRCCRVLVVERVSDESSCGVVIRCTCT